MNTIQDQVSRTMMKFTLVGSALGFISFILVGAIPGILYGGYLGLMMTGALFGTPIEVTLVAQLITGGGMLLGVLASLFFFLVLGAISGTALALFLRPVLLIIATRNTDFTGDGMGSSNPPPGSIVAELRKGLPEKRDASKVA